MIGWFSPQPHNHEDVARTFFGLIDIPNVYGARATLTPSLISFGLGSSSLCCAKEVRVSASVVGLAVPRGAEEL